MRLPTFSFLRHCRFKPLFSPIPRRLSSNLTQTEVAGEAGNESYVELSPSWPPEEHPELRAQFLRDMRVLPDFISEEEEADMLAELEPQLKRMRYEYDHWDNAIEGYRETERGSWSGCGGEVLERVKRAAAILRPLSRTHVLDLAAAGHIRPHVDAVRFCGAVIAGLCLCSSAVMVLRHSQRPQLSARALLARRALYIMRGVARYEFTHAVPGGGGEGAGGGGGGAADEGALTWRGERIERRRRVAVITREAPPTHQ